MLGEPEGREDCLGRKGKLETQERMEHLENLGLQWMCRKL